MDETLLDPGKPLGFFGTVTFNAVTVRSGMTPALLRRVFPMTLFTPITSDDKAYCQEWKARNKEERKGH